MDRARLFHLAAAFEFYVFAVTFVVCVCILSVAAALFMVTKVLSHNPSATNRLGFISSTS